MLKEGQVFAHFSVIRKLGQGGMGAVYLAEDEKLKRQVALKVLTSELFTDQERHERFHREARTAAQVSHANIMAIYDLNEGTDPETGKTIHYIVMEHVDGKPLTVYLKEKGSDLANVLRLAEKIASGIAAAHRINVVHRDIKPENILVNADGEPKILDFGLAKPLSPVQMQQAGEGGDTVSQELTRVGKILGTVSYMSPEQIRGEAVDTRSDIFSFGILLYRMASGELPFTGNTQVSTMAKILETRHEPVRKRNESIPAELERIIDKCLQKDPADRYQDTRDLVVDLRNLRKLYDSGISEQTASILADARGHRTYKLKLNWPTVAVVAVAAMLAVVAIMKLTGKSSAGGGLRAQSNALAVLGFENKTGDASLDWLESGLAEMLVTDLSQDRSLNLISSQRIREQAGGKDLRTLLTDGNRDWARAASELGASNVLTGAVYKLGAKIRIDARLEEIDGGKILMAEKVIGEDPFELVDTLTDRVGLALNIQMAGGSRSVAELTSSSPEAYRYYLQGMEKFQAELMEDAVRLFERSLAIDSTFALPYMRIGMAYAFISQQQQGAEYFAKALMYEQRLPVRERTLLDVYADIWLRRKFNDAFAKMEAMVRTYPDDDEARGIYAILVHEFQQDTVKLFAQMDTVLQQNPRQIFALSYLANYFVSKDDRERATKYAGLMKVYHPESPSPNMMLGRLYQRAGELEKARQEYQAALQVYPDYEDALEALIGLAFRERKFDEAAGHVETYGRIYGDNPFKRQVYLGYLAELENWRGHFLNAIAYANQAIQILIPTGDSNRIAGAYGELFGGWYVLGYLDSARQALETGWRWTPSNQIGNYPIMIVELDPSQADKARSELAKRSADFRSRVPSELWVFTDIMNEMVEANIANDTVAQIASFRRMISASRGESRGNLQFLAKLLIRTGQFDEGITLLEPQVTGNRPLSDPIPYLTARYYLGVAYEGKGQRAKAREQFEEILRYWGSPDVEFYEIKDARSRLAHLTG